MAIQIGDSLPDGTFIEMGEDGPAEVTTSQFTTGKTVIFGLPGAYTGTCTTAHVPSFIRTKDALAAKGVTDILCISVNDPFVMQAWGESTGASAAGIRMLADADASFTKALGMEFTAPPVGLFDRSKRYSMVVDGGKVTQLNEEPSPGECEIAAGETLLAQL
ncbi:MAG: peroxiredoxin [Pseudomonadota bacterium]